MKHYIKTASFISLFGQTDCRLLFDTFLNVVFEKIKFLKTGFFYCFHQSKSNINCLTGLSSYDWSESPCSAFHWFNPVYALRGREDEDGDHGKLVEKHQDFQGPDVEHSGLEELDRVYGACARLSRGFQLQALCSHQIREYYSRVRSMVNIQYFRNISSLKNSPAGAPRILVEAPCIGRRLVIS